METQTNQSELDRASVEDEILVQLISSLRKLSPESRLRILRVLATHFQIESHEPAQHTSGTDFLGTRTLPAFSEDRSLSPKEFMLQKKPETDIERIACLAYYLTHYRDTPEFKTLDLSKLNTEAAQIKFSNAALAVSNTARAGFVVPSSRGNKQMSALGEIYVRALPDRTAAKEALSSARPRRKSKKQASLISKAK